MYPRHLAGSLLEALSDRPVVLLHGARQTGKTTLVREIVSKRRPARYLTFDDAGALAAAQADPQGFLDGLESPVVLDEVQRVPDLFLALKRAVDHDRRPGRFLLTGSANVLLLPRLSESLAGRMEVLTLRSLSQGEIEGTREGFVDALFSATLPPFSLRRGEETGLEERVAAGGYPEIAGRIAARRRRAWFGSYLTTVLQRDVRDLARIEGLTLLPRLLSLIAARSAALVNFAELSRSGGLPQSTLKRYVSLLEATHLVEMLPAWSKNLGKRVAKAPKLLVADSGLACHLLGLDAGRLREDRTVLGPLLEGFVAMEVLKQAGWSDTGPGLFHFRTHAGNEVDLVLEDPGGAVVGIEVKAGATVGADDFRGLRVLAEASGRRFRRGVVLYTGREPIPFGARLQALPVAALWCLGARGATG